MQTDTCNTLLELPYLGNRDSKKNKNNKNGAKTSVGVIQLSNEYELLSSVNKFEYLRPSFY